jgi:hypothetical protein
MNPWMIAAMYFALDTRSRSDTEVESLRKQLEDLKKELDSIKGAASVKPAGQFVRSLQDPSTWCWQPFVEPETEPTESAEPERGAFFESILEEELEYLDKMSDRTVQAYFAPD